MMRLHRNPEENNRDQYFKIRNILNIIFMIGAVVGMGFYFFGNRTIGTIIIIIAIVIKLTESSIRLIHR